LAKAAELGVNDPPLYNFLGISYSRIGRLPEAVRSYKRGLELDPRLADAHLNLAFAYQRLGRTAAAGKEYRQACDLEAKFCELMPARPR
jgi:Flp pilus assembly protein TadD